MLKLFIFIIVIVKIRNQLLPVIPVNSKCPPEFEKNNTLCEEEDVKVLPLYTNKQLKVNTNQGSNYCPEGVRWCQDEPDYKSDEDRPGSNDADFCPEGVRWCQKTRRARVFAHWIRKTLLTKVPNLLNDGLSVMTRDSK
ncbi:hypothetical protein B5X24_HaOG207394 [Helicoverpa armigera]|uniref:P-type domain-containing protein n=1 Tax=Helicoverpa armigera TaxID=29058 RepID=A0A2W1BSD5_HELAM|nr:hypothetical protein B5X24_HaOG207394 [Helicoverpa armigera]